MSPNNLHRLAEWPSEDILFCLAASEDFQRLWIGSSDAGVYEVDITAETPQRAKLLGDGHSSYVMGMARAGDLLVTGGYDKHLIWWDTESRTQIRSIKAHEKWIRRLALTPDARRVLSVGDDMWCRIWDVESGSLVAEFTDHAEFTPNNYPSMLYAVAISTDGARIATGDRTGHVAIWDGASFAKLGELEAPVMYTWDPRQRRHSIGGIRSLAFSPGGDKLAVGGMGNVGNIDHLDGASRLEIFDIESGERLHEIEDKEKKGLVEQISWSPDGNWIMAAGGQHNGFIWIYDAATGKQLQAVEQSGHIHGVVHDASFENIYLAGHGRVSRWTLNSA